jgi:hypothetical protein
VEAEAEAARRRGVVMMGVVTKMGATRKQMDLVDLHPAQEQNLYLLGLLCRKPKLLLL